MTEPQAHTESVQDNDPVKWIGLGFIIGIIVAVVALEMYGYIKHPNDNDAATIDEFRLLALKTNMNIKVSPKPSGKEAFCANGYLLLRPTNGNETAGIMVDGRDRGVKCRYGFAKTENEENYLKKQAPEASE